MLATICWQLWLSKNRLVFQTTPSEPIAILHRAQQQWQKFLDLPFTYNKSAVQQSQNSMCWEPPSTGQIKLNCDAALNSRNNTGRLVVIGRDNNGKVLHVATANIKCCSAAAAEAIAIREVVRFMGNFNIHGAIAESDTQVIISAINKGFDNVTWEYDVVLQDIQTLAAELGNGSIVFRHISRQVNQVTDWLSKCEILISINDIICNSHNKLSCLLQEEACYPLYAPILV